MDLEHLDEMRRHREVVYMARRQMANWHEHTFQLNSLVGLDLELAKLPPKGP